LVATSVGDNAYFCGGDIGSPSQSSDTVDVVNPSNFTKSTATISLSRTYLAGTSTGIIAMFGGGYTGATYSSAVDIYNVTSNIWFTANLSQPRYWLAATSSTNKIFFGGGLNRSGSSNIVDIFDVPAMNSVVSAPNATNTTSVNPVALTPVSKSFSGSPLPASNISQISAAPFSPPNSEKLGENNLIVISASILGVLISGIGALLAAAIILIYLLIREKRKNKKTIQKPDPKVPSLTQTRGTIVIEPVTNDVFGNAIASTCLPGTETLKEMSPGQISLNELEIGQDIGEGLYGRVCLGKWKNTPVALKFCQNRGKMDEFMREVNLMITLPPHPNVVRMYGVSIDGTQPIIVMEYCSGGSLDKLLFDERKTISNELKIQWVNEVALGMCHLHKYNIVHRDLAARNILLSHPNPIEAHLKITDFGMSRVLQQDIEGRTMNIIGPLRWMAPESIGQQVYSKKSDVWMFGVLVYEIVAQREPHVDIDVNNAAVLIRDQGLTPEIPRKCPQKLRQVMEMCWKKQPQQRPTFDIIVAIMKQ